MLCLLRDTDLKPEDTIGASVAVVSAHGARPPANLLRVLDTEPKPENEVVEVLGIEESDQALENTL